MTIIKPQSSTTPAVLKAKQAAAYVGMSVRWLMDRRCPIPWVDARLPGARRPVRRWRLADLDTFLVKRLVQPGHRSPYGL